MIWRSNNLFFCFLFIKLFVFISFVANVAVGGTVSGKILTMGGAISWFQKKIMAEEEEIDFPKDLEGFGFKFNEEGQMRHIETNEAFVFDLKEDDYHYNQKRYNALGDVVTEYIYKIMQKEHKLQKSFLPIDAEENEPRSFAFISGDLYTNTDKLMVIIHGSGAVRAGQWSRRLIINEGMDVGSQLPYIKWAREQGYAVVVANTNLNTAEHGDKRHKKPIKIKGNSTPEEHVESLWREFVQRSAAKHVAVIAHSYGGVCVLELAKNHIMEFESRVFAIALTDSVHGLRQQKAAPEVVQFYKLHGKNWASAYDPLDAPLITNQDDVPTVSAGTDRHENTSYSSMNSIFKWFIEKYDHTVNPTSSLSNPDSTPTRVTDEQALINLLDEEPASQIKDPTSPINDPASPSNPDSTPTPVTDEQTLIDFLEPASLVKDPPSPINDPASPINDPASPSNLDSTPTPVTDEQSLIDFLEPASPVKDPPSPINDPASPINDPASPINDPASPINDQQPGAAKDQTSVDVDDKDSVKLDQVKTEL